MAKKLQAVVKLHIPAGKATPQPPVGPALGQQGVNIMEFCKAFNARTKDFPDGALIPVVIRVFTDRSFTFVTKTPLTSYLLLKAAKIEKGSPTPLKTSVAQISRAQLREIATAKLPDLNTQDVEKAMRIVEGTAKSMGIAVAQEG